MYRYFMIFHAKKGAATQAEIIGQIDLTGRLWKWGIVKQYVQSLRSRSRTSIRIFPHFGVHIYWSAAAWFISSVETWGSLQFSGYWKRSMAIKIGYPPIIETTPIFTDMFLSNYNYIYISQDFQQMTLIMHTLHTVHYMCIYIYLPKSY